MAEQLQFRGFVTGPVVGRRRVQQALGAYVAGRVAPSFELRRLAEEQARLEALRQALRRRSKLGRVELAITPAGARIERSLRACVARIEELEDRLLCA